MQILKYHGSYMQTDREKKGKPKDYQFMLRLKQPAGELPPDLFRLLDDPDPDQWAGAATPRGATAAVRRVLQTESSVPTWRLSAKSILFPTRIMLRSSPRICLACSIQLFTFSKLCLLVMSYTTTATLASLM